MTDVEASVSGVDSSTYTGYSVDTGHSVSVSDGLVSYDDDCSLSTGK